MATLTSNFPTDPGAIVASLDRTGWVCLENVISDDWLARARDHVRSLINRHGEKYFIIIRPADEEGSPPRELACHPLMQAMLRDVTRLGYARGAVEWEEIYNTLRVVAGPDGHRGSREFHYDASVVTALVPIFIPEPGNGHCGDLAIFTNKRGYRNLFANLIEKAVVQSRPYRRMMARKVDDDLEANRRMLRPGNVYLFWGYRSYHGNLPCAANTLRATMLLHHGNPHGRRVVLEGFRTLRRMIETRRLVQPPLQ